MIVGHSFQMNRSPRSHNLIEGGSSIGQFALSSDFDGTAVRFPFHAAIIKWIRSIRKFRPLLDRDIISASALPSALSSRCHGPLPKRPLCEFQRVFVVGLPLSLAGTS